MNPIYYRSFTIQLTVALLLLCLELMVGYGLDIRRLHHQLEQTREARIATLQSISAAQNQLTSYQHLQIQFDDWQRRFSKALQPLHNPLTLSSLLQQLSAQAEHQGLKLQAIIPLKPSHDGVFIIQPIQLNAVSNYLSFIQFIAHLDKLGMPLKVIHFGVVANNEQTQPLTTLTLEAYKLAPSSTDIKTSTNELITLFKKLNPALPTAPTYSPVLQMRDPFEQKTQVKNQRHCNQQSLLTCFPLNEYQVLGVIQQQERFWATVRDPKGNIHQITVGMRLGDRQSPITHIDTKAVTLTHANPPKTIFLPVKK
jgi:Tfp pilus assembly protein PilO/Tfp pilus assembly protein PilP